MLLPLSNYTTLLEKIMKFSRYLALSLSLSGMALALDIYPQVSSKIIEMKAVGEKVNVEDTIVKLDDRQAQLKLKHLNAIAAIKQQDFDDAQLTLDQTKELYDRMVSSHRDLDIAQMDFNAKKRELDAHKIQIEIQVIELEKYTIKSPIAGSIKATPELRNTTNASAPKVLMVID